MRVRRRSAVRGLADDLASGSFDAVNNFIDVTDFKPYTGDKSFEQEKKKEELQHFLKEGEDVDNHTEVQGTLQDMITLLRNWVFMMFAVSNFLTSLGYPIPYSFVHVSFP